MPEKCRFNVPTDFNLDPELLGKEIFNQEVFNAMVVLNNQ